MMHPTVALVSQGEMGAGIGKRLVERGLRVVTSLAGRSEASAQRAREAGMISVSDREMAEADLFLSVVPPAEALAMAQRMAAVIEPSNHKPVYVDCNAVSPPTKRTIGAVVTAAGAPFVDASIMGASPRPNYDGPSIIASGPDAEGFVPLNDFGLKIRVIDGPVGAASALKMSYAGITKGTTALGSMMMLAATRAGVAGDLLREFESSHPSVVATFRRAVPDMFGKAYRFVGEMEEIADFVSEDPAAQKMYQAIAEFYTRMAADVEGDQKEAEALRAFLAKPGQQ